MQKIGKEELLLELKIDFWSDLISVNCPWSEQNESLMNEYM